MPKRRLDRIVIGERHRQDMGDLDELAASIAAVGLLQPIGITPDDRLLFGERRLRVCRQLGHATIPVVVHDVDPDDRVRVEAAENNSRKNFSLSEAVAIKRALEPVARADARGRMLGGQPLENFSKGRALDKVAQVAGKHRTTIAKAEVIVDAAEAEPERFGKLLADMNRTGRVNGIYRRLRNIRAAEAIRAEPPPLPGRGPYRVAVCDVPWPFEVDDPDPAHRGAWPFPTMSLDALCAINIGSIMGADSILWFWVTNHHLRHAYRLLDAFGFHQTPTMLTWAKDRMGNGHWLRGQTEHCILAVRGKPVITPSNETTLLHAPVRGHSVKPVEFYDLVERLCPAPRYADLFSRYRHNERWDCHGDQAPAPLEAAQ